MTALTSAERARRFHARRRASAETAVREAYRERRAVLARERVRTVPHFKRWASRLRLDTHELLKLEPFQVAFVRDLFAGRPVNWFVLPEGNAKTTLIAMLALYHLEFTLDAAIAVAAASRDQAGLIYGQSEGFIERARDDELEDFADFELHPGYRRIEYLPNRSRLQILAADDKTGDGIIPTLALIDELHRHRDLKLYRTWRGKLGKRDGQLIVISTAGEPGSEFEQARERLRQHAQDIKRRGSFIRAANGSTIIHEWAVQDGQDVEDVRVVKRANPLKAITVASLRSKLDDPAMTLAHWRRLTCNLPTRSDEAAITEAEWEAARTDERIPEGEPIWIGLDVAWKWDTTAITPLWMPEPTQRLLGPAAVLTPPRDGRHLDARLIEKALTEIDARNPIHTVVMDTSRAEQLALWISDTFGAEVIERPQTPAHAVNDYERFMEALRQGWLKHSGDEALTRHAMNAIASVDRFGAARFERSSPTRSGGAEQERRVIDALTAASMVNAQASVQPEPDLEPMVALR